MLERGWANGHPPQLGGGAAVLAGELRISAAIKRVLVAKLSGERRRQTELAATLSGGRRRQTRSSASLSGGRRRQTQFVVTPGDAAVKVSR